MVKTDFTRDDCLASAIKSIGKHEFTSDLAAFIRACMSFDNLIAIAYQGEQKPEVLFREFDDPVVYEQMDTAYVTANYVLDPFYKAHLEGVTSGLHHLFDLAPDRFKQTSYFKLYYEQTTLIDEVAIFSRTESGATITICIGTDRSSGRMFSRKEIAVLRGNAGAIRALVECHWRELRMKKTSAEPPVVDRLRSLLTETCNISLSPRQAEVALLVLQGHSSTSISLLLGVSMHTIKVFRRQLYAKCKISSQAQLFAMLLPLIGRK